MTQVAPNLEVELGTLARRQSAYLRALNGRLLSESEALDCGLYLVARVCREGDLTPTDRHILLTLVAHAGIGEMESLRRFYDATLIARCAADPYSPPVVTACTRLLRP